MTKLLRTFLSTLFIFISISGFSTPLSRTINSQEDIDALSSLTIKEDTLNLFIYAFVGEAIDMSQVVLSDQVKNLRFNFLSYYDYGGLIARALLTLPNELIIEKLEIPSIKLLASFSNSSQSQLFIDNFFLRLSQLSHLRSLNLSETGLLTPETNIESLAKLQGLEELQLEGFFWPNQSFEKLEVLSRLPHLKRLSLNNNWKLDENELKFILSLPSLETLNIANNTGVLTFPSGVFPKIRELDLSGNFITHLNFSTSFPNLKHLDLKFADLFGSLLDLFLSTKLESLSLQRVVVTQESLELMNLGTFPNLLELDVSSNLISTLKFSQFAPLLKKLDLSYSNISNRDMEEIVLLKDLEELNLEKTKISPNALKHLSKLPRLKKLNLSDTSKMRDAPLHLLEQLPELQELFLNKTNLSLEDIEKLKQLVQLKKLELKELKNGNITRELLKKLQDSLPNCEISF